jgi:hypothetical protein
MCTPVPQLHAQWSLRRDWAWPDSRPYRSRGSARLRVAEFREDDHVGFVPFAARQEGTNGRGITAGPDINGQNAHSLTHRPAAVLRSFYPAKPETWPHADLGSNTV